MTEFEIGKSYTFGISNIIGYYEATVIRQNDVAVKFDRFFNMRMTSSDSIAGDNCSDWVNRSDLYNVRQTEDDMGEDDYEDGELQGFVETGKKWWQYRKPKMQLVRIPYTKIGNVLRVGFHNATFMGIGRIEDVFFVRSKA